MTDNNLNSIFSDYEDKIIDIKLAINDNNKPSSDDIITQMQNIVASYKKGQTNEFSDY